MLYLAILLIVQLIIVKNGLCSQLPLEWNDKNNYFANTISEFLLLLMNLQDVYSEKDIELMVKALFLGQKTLSYARMWGGGTFHSHFISTSHCTLKAKLPAKYIALTLVHSIYLQAWMDDSYNSKDTQCHQRNYVQEVLGVETEELLYRYTVTFGNGPWHTCPTAWLEMLKHGLLDEIDKKIVQVVLCDDLDEPLTGDMWLGNNWKRRDSKFESNLIAIAEMLEAYEIKKYLELAFKTVHAVFHEDGLPKLIKDATTNEKELYRNKVNAPLFNYANGDLNLIKKVQGIVKHTTAHKHILGEPKSQAASYTINAIELSREMCDAFAIHKTMNITAYAQTLKESAKLVYTSCVNYDPKSRMREMKERKLLKRKGKSLAVN